MSLVRVLVNRSCGHCVRAVDAVSRLAARHGAAVAAVDLTAHPGLARRLRLQHSPAVLFDDGVAYAGVPDEHTFAALAHNRPKEWT